MKKIATLEIQHPFVAAPLAGITDASMRSICKRMGAALTYTEMVSGKGLLYENRNTEELLFLEPGEGPVGFQIFGADPAVMEETAFRLANRKNTLIDINMGCPVPKIVKNGEGSALLRSLDLLHDVAAAVVKGTRRGAGDGLPKPVTAKIRTGWDEGHIVTVEAAKALEEAGVSAVTVHGRTREQFYSGRADWEQIGAVKKAISIPVIGNGDVWTAKDGLAMMDQTGCDLVMVGRGMLGNPWIFRDLLAVWQGEPVPERPTRQEKAQVMEEHFQSMCRLKGDHRATLEMRKQIGWYMKGEQGAAATRRRVNSIVHPEEMKREIQAFGEGQ